MAVERGNFYFEKQKVIPLTIEMQQNLHKSIWVLFIVCKLFGCAPLQDSSLQQQIEGTVKKKCVFIIMLNIIWSAFIYCSISFAIYSQISGFGLKSVELQKSLAISECLVGLVHITYINVIIYRHHKKILQIHKNIFEFDQKLLQINTSPHYWRFHRFISINLIVIAIHFCCDLLVNYFNNQIIWVHVIRDVFMNTFFNLVACQYYGLLYGILLRLTKLNNAITVLVEHCSEERGILQQIRGLYARLEFFTHSINQIYGFSILLHMLGAIINLSVNVFLLYKCIDNHATCNLHWILHATLSGCMHLARVILLLKFNSSIRDQKSFTTLLLNRMQCYKINTRETVTHFLLQLTMKPRSHVIFGVLDLKMEFIISVLLAVINMFAFLLQYEITFKALAKMQQIN